MKQLRPIPAALAATLATALAATLAALLAACAGYDPFLGPRTRLADYPALVALDFVPADAYGFAVSPDGTRLAYTVRRVLHVADLAARTTRAVAASGDLIQAVGWAPDGGSVLFLPQNRAPVTEPGEPAATPAPEYPEGRLQRVDLATGAITTPAIAAPAPQLLAGSPDGRWLALAREGKLALWDARKDVESSVAGDAGGAGGYPVSWSPDGRRLAWVGATADGGLAARVTEIGAGPGDEGATTRTLPAIAPTRVRMDVEGGCYPEEEKLAWLPGGDGLTLVQGLERRKLEVATFGPDGAETGRRTIDLTDPADGRRYADCYHPSPDGRAIVALKFNGSGSMPPGAYSLVAIDTATGRARDVAPPAGFVGWVGRSTRFLLSVQEQGLPRLYLADAAP